MPKKLEQALKREAARRGYTGERADRFVYGTMQAKTNWKPKQKKKGKGK